MAQFPQVSGRNIDGVTYHLPSDFAGQYNVILMAFTREQQDEVDTWLAQLRPLESQMGHIRIYELPTLRRFNVVRQMQIDYWMNAGISDPLARETTITLYTDLDAIAAAMQINSMARIHTALVDQKGQVYWQGTGRYEPSQYDALRAVIQSLPQTV